MPELPEVETIRNWLRNGTQGQPSILGLKILDTELLWSRTLATPTPRDFKQRIQGQAIEDLSRRGKFLVFQLSQDYLILHLRMSGDLVISSHSEALAAHDRLVLFLEEDVRLAFNDARKFGRAWFVSDPGQVLSGLGPEPLDADFTAQDLYRKLHGKKRQLKPLLTDQKFLAGLGNIYADEALHLAKLHPLTRSDRVSTAQAQSLWSAIRQTLNEGIRRNGASIDWVYRGGDFQNYFRVYQRTGEPCLECQSEVTRIVVGQRSTHFCPRCQALEFEE